MNFKGSRVLVIGASCEIGHHCLRLLAKQNLQLFVTYRSDAKREALETLLSQLNTDYSLFRLDLGDRPALSNLFSAIGHCDYLLDLAHQNYEALLASASSETVAGYFDSHVAFRADLLRFATRSMLANRFGRLVFLSSIAADRCNPGQAFYAASKLASEALYKSAGLELAQRGISSAVLRAGLVDSGRGHTYLDHCPQSLHSIPTHKPLQPGEVAGFLGFLLSDDAIGLNSSVVTLDQGQSATKAALSQG